MTLVPVIQPPIMRALTTHKERTIRMGQLRQVSKTETIIFPIAVTIIVSLLLPDAATLIGMLMLGNLMRVCGVVERINKTAQNELCNIVTIFLGLTVGATTQGSTFLTMQTIYIVILGVIAFSFGTAGGVLLAKLMNILSGGQINPLIGSAGVSAVPMAARVSQKVGQEEDPGNFLLMHAMGPKCTPWAPMSPASSAPRSPRACLSLSSVDRIRKGLGQGEWICALSTWMNAAALYAGWLSSRADPVPCSLFPVP